MWPARETLLAGEVLLDIFQIPSAWVLPSSDRATLQIGVVGRVTLISAGAVVPAKGLLAVCNSFKQQARNGLLVPAATASF